MLVLGEDEFFADWVASRLDIPIETKICTAVGIMDGHHIMGGVVYSHFYGHDIQMTIATTDKRWATRATLRTLFKYPFDQLKVERVTATTAKSNKKARKMLEKLGFKLEGVLRKGYDGKRDAVVYGMLKEECRWRI